MSRPIVYYDGLCGLCDGFVRFIVARDRLARYRFAPLQGETARDRLGARLGSEELGTVVLEERAGVHRVRSDAALAILAGLGHGWQLVTALRIVPRPLRDWIYDWIARHRFRWFPKRAECRVPSPEERDRFLP